MLSTLFIISVTFSVLFVIVMATRTNDLPYLTRRLTVELMFSRRLADEIQVICDSFRQGDDEFGDIAIIQCARQVFVSGNEINQIFESFPGMIKHPASFRARCSNQRVAFNELLKAMGVGR